MTFRQSIKFLFIPLILILLAACQGVTGVSPTATLEIQSTPTPEPQKLLTICLGQEPSSLYIYKGNSMSMWSVLEAIYDGPIDTREYQAVPVILEKIPSLADGDALLQPIPVQEGDLVIDSKGDLISLAAGSMILPSGCSSSDCAIAWDGTTPLTMDRMVVNYRIKPGITWSDGQPLLASDSVYSYNLAADPATPVNKRAIDATTSYQALDERTVQWIGKPGRLSRDLSVFFWIPLPEHAWGSLSAADLQSAIESNQKPLGWGPYVIDEWVQGDHIRLVKNPGYYRASEDLPKFDTLVFRFQGDEADSNLAALVNGVCDIVDQTARLEDDVELTRHGELIGKMRSYFGMGPQWEHLEFGIKPASYDDGYSAEAGDRPDYFGDARTRQAVAYCLDRNRVNTEVFHSLSVMAKSYIPPLHPLYTEDLADYDFDTAKGNQLLEEVGWQDQDGNPETPRTSLNIPNVPDGTAFVVDYATTDADVRQQFAAIFKESLAQCGIQINISTFPAADLYSPGPDGILFGRKFDLAEFGWAVGNQPPCYLYLSDEIPSAPNNWLGAGRGGANISGWSNADFDAACEGALQAGLDGEKYAASQILAAQILARELPVAPLYFQQKLAVSRTDLCGMSLDVSSRSEFWNLEAYEIGPQCPETNESK